MKKKSQKIDDSFNWKVCAYCLCLPCGWLWWSRLCERAYLTHMNPCANLHGAPNRDFLAA